MANGAAATSGELASDREKKSPRLSLSRRGWLVTGTLAITAAFWVAGRYGEFSSGALWPWRGPSQVVMLWSAALASLAMLAVVRARALEPLFGGLDMAVRLHRKLGLASLLLLTAHVVLLVADTVKQGASLAEVLVPSGDEEVHGHRRVLRTDRAGISGLRSQAPPRALARDTSGDRPVVPVWHAPRGDAAGHDKALRAAPYLDRTAAHRPGCLDLSRLPLPAFRAALPVSRRVGRAARERDRRPGHAPGGEAHDVRTRDLRLCPRAELQGQGAGAASRELGLPNERIITEELQFR